LATRRELTPWSVHIEGLEEGSELFQSIEGAVLKDWLGTDAVR
jgi:hypothetical protein